MNDDFIKNPRIFMEPVLVLIQVYLEPLGINLIDCTPGGKLRFITKGRFTTSAPYFEITKAI